MTQLVNTSIPVLQSIPHALDLFHIQHLGLHPVDLSNLANLVNSTLQQSQRQRLHNQVFDLLGPHLGLCGDGRKGQVAVVRRAAEYHFRQCRKRDLLVEEKAVGMEELVLGDVAREDVIGG